MSVFRCLSSFTEIRRVLSNAGTEMSDKFISEYESFQTTLRKQNRYQNSKPYSVNGLNFHVTVRHVIALSCVALLHLWLLLCANNKGCWKLEIFNKSSFSIRRFCIHCLCSHIFFSCSHHKQLNDNLKGITSEMLTDHKQLALMSSS